MRRWRFVLSVLALLFAAPLAANPQLVVLTDIGNEPDDQMSLVRLLLYSNEIDVAAIIASTSVWQRDKVSPEIIGRVIAAYGAVQPNLELHAAGWPKAADLQARVFKGVAGYGLAAMHPDAPSTGAARLLELARQDSTEPLWINCWGGANTLAEALEHARRTLPAAELARIVARLRVYAISDQDDAGPWLRREFPGLFYIVSPSSQDSGDYARSTWTGIAGDQYYRNGAGADFSTVSNAWLDLNIRAKGTLGKAYPKYMFIMEGDTPAFLGLIDNGLNALEQPNWGGWGGRYLLRTPAGESRPIWTQGGDMFLRVSSADTVNGQVSDQATIWRWRQAFQHDFAARMDWTVQPFGKANHPPQVDIAGDDPQALVLNITLKQGERRTLDASPSRDPDGDRLGYRWFHYAEAGAAQGTNLAELTLTRDNTAKVTIQAGSPCRKPWLDGLVRCKGNGTAHVILAVTDQGRPALTRYRRVVVEVTP